MSDSHFATFPYSYKKGDNADGLLSRIRHMIQSGEILASRVIFGEVEVLPTMNITKTDISSYFNTLRAEVFGAAFSDRPDHAHSSCPDSDMLGIFIEPLRRQKVSEIAIVNLAVVDLEVYQDNCCPAVSSEIWAERRIPCFGGWIKLRDAVDKGTYSAVLQRLALGNSAAFFDGRRWVEVD